MKAARSKLLGLFLPLLLALQLAVPSLASWHQLTAHHQRVHHTERTSLSNHYAEPSCPLCELARHSGDHLQGPAATTLSLRFSTCDASLPDCPLRAGTISRTPYAPRAPPLS